MNLLLNERMNDTHNSSHETFHSICEYHQTVQWIEPNSFTIPMRWCSLRESLLSYIIRSLIFVSLSCSVVRCFVCITTAITIAIATEFSIAGWCVNIEHRDVRFSLHYLNMAICLFSYTVSIRNNAQLVQLSVYGIYTHSHMTIFSHCASWILSFLLSIPFFLSFVRSWALLIHIYSIVGSLSRHHCLPHFIVYFTVLFFPNVQMHIHISRASIIKILERRSRITECEQCVWWLTTLIFSSKANENQTKRKWFIFRLN